MATKLAKNRKVVKEQEAKEDKDFFGKMGESNEANEKSGRTAVQPSNDDTQVGSVSTAEKDGGIEAGEKGNGGGFIKADNGKNSEVSGETAKTEASKRKLEEINYWADKLLSCLPPEAKQNFQIAAFDAKVTDIGLYILGILNRMHKMADYFEPDIEREWELGVIGYDQLLYCQYCQKLIENPKHLQQMFCNNLCARNYKLKNQTGILYPKEIAATTQDPEEKAWEREQKRLGAR